jgi:glycosyltransferase involved in cell wall biosynthesis
MSTHHSIVDQRSARPRVTIGMPVYNGARHVAAAIDSLLQQTCTEFELVVSDNASTDETGDIVRGYERRDPRIRYIRQKANIGAPANWNFVVREARGTYFKWASGNDIVPAAMLARCVEVMDSDPRVVLCYGRTELIDDAGQSLGIYAGDIDIRQERPSERFARVYSGLAMNNAQCGLIRLDVLRTTRLDRPYPAGDMVLMAELALRGHFVLLPEVLLYRRSAERSSSSKLSTEELQEFFAPGRPAADPISYLAWRKHIDYLWTTVSTPIPWPERLRSLLIALQHMVWARMHLLGELRLGLAGLLRR